MWVVGFLLKCGENMENIKTIELNEEIESNFFYQSISIYLKKTQVVNRKLSCSSNVAFVKLNIKTCDLVTCEKAIKKNLEKDLNSSENVLESVKDTLTGLGIEFTEECLDILKEFNESDTGIYLSIDRFLPRNLQKFSNCLVATVIGEKLQI